MFGLLANPLGRSARAIELSGTNLLATQGGYTSTISLEELIAPPSVLKGVLGSTISLSITGKREVIVRGTRFSDASRFADEVKLAWVDFNLQALEREADRLTRLHAEIANLARPARYSAACLITPILADATSLDASLLSKLHPEAIGSEMAALVARVRDFAADPKTFRSAAIVTL